MDDSAASIAQDIAAVKRISAVPSLLRIVCDNTGMRFAAVARVTEGTWTACAVQDGINLGLLPGNQLDVHSTLCKEARASRQPIAFDHASEDPVYRGHHTPRIYGIESYISVPIVRPGGEYFGNLCALDPVPRHVTDPKTMAMFQSFAELIGRQLDVEERQEETEDALLDARATAELREQFIAVLGHDLRSPLASIGAIGQILARRPEADIARYGRRLNGSTDRMSKLIEDVLDFARGRMGSGMGLRIVLVDDLESALRNVVAELRDSHAEWNVDEHYKIDGGVECDLGRMQQLLSNLLGNALAHGALDTPVSVDVVLEAQWLSISVTNGGLPIATSNLEKIFEPYWRPAESKPGGGLGLGLHICSQIVQAHGGNLSVVSDLENGTRFTAKIPARRSITSLR